MRSEISNLHGYLSITHFLGQASTQRFSARKPDKLWEALKGPAGVDRINALRERMSGLGVRRAFTRAIEEHTRQLEGAIEALDEWTAPLAERDRARQLSSSDQALPPLALRKLVDTLGAQILRLVPNLTWSPAEPSTRVETVLENFAGLLRVVEQRNVVDREAADALAKIASAFDDAGAETVNVRNRAADIERRRVAAVEKLTEAEAALAEATTGLAVNERHLAHIQARALSLHATTGCGPSVDGIAGPTRGSRGAAGTIGQGY